ncbi:MAG: helix-turn-helix domain-containing protein [Armatimonadetes bacterium]|nr:helix-turn-helix domain-containing protein [Armatimonadota bacterium]MDE2206653.1 helix-turn-helix domain-containing protein [Armatimonadota bacterium]
MKAHCGLHGFAELCEPFGTRRSTGYKWVSHFAADGFAGLAQRSNVPRSGPHRTPEAICALL